MPISRGPAALAPLPLMGVPVVKRELVAESVVLSNGESRLRVRRTAVDVEARRSWSRDETYDTRESRRVDTAIG